MDVKEEQPLKQYPPKLVTEEGIVMDFKEEQPPKHLFPKLVTEEGIVMDFKEEQSPKHCSPKLVTVKDTPPSVTLAGITTSIGDFLHCKSTAVSVSVSNS